MSKYNLSNHKYEQILQRSTGESPKITIFHRLLPLDIPSFSRLFLVREAESSWQSVCPRISIFASGTITRYSIIGGPSPGPFLEIGSVCAKGMSRFGSQPISFGRERVGRLRNGPACGGSFEDPTCHPHADHRTKKEQLLSRARRKATWM